MADPTQKFDSTASLEPDPRLRITGILAIVCGAVMMLYWQLPAYWRVFHEEGFHQETVFRAILVWPPALLRDIFLIMGGIRLMRQQRSGYVLVLGMGVFHWVSNFLFFLYFLILYGSVDYFATGIQVMLGLHFPANLSNLLTIFVNACTIIWFAFLLRSSLRHSLQVRSGHSIGATALGIGLALYSLVGSIVWRAILSDMYIGFQF